MDEVQIKPGQVWRRKHDQAEFEVLEILEVFPSYAVLARYRGLGRGLEYVHPWVKGLRRSYELVRDVEGDEQ